MNARQKAKRLKKELDYIKNQPIREYIKVIGVEAEHLRACRVFTLDEIKRLGEEVIEEEAKHQLSFDFLNHIRENMIIEKNNYIDGFGTVRYSADIWMSFGKERRQKDGE